ncbi:hypothetical protein [uncultured Bradyrhizobium sp.]|jgi:hypothetical protein|uniref:hypothetical protein n=1 Tax=uncultured Bradyrhizobium sp. TaxID=199684 RepID=UPI002633204E|nr:hypothetical protein [uncultured Bradyrhizobium sp.]
MFGSIAEHFTQHSEAAATLLLGFLGVVTYLYTWSHDRKHRKRDNYLALEFQSMRVFQACVENPEIPLYLDGKDVEPTDRQHIKEKTYWQICQILNLFEIIISYRKEVPDEVFATWVSWFHELGTAPRFEEFWRGEELRSHYKGDLQKIMNTALQLYKTRSADFETDDHDYENELKAFYDQIAIIMDDKSIWKHLDISRGLNEQVA